MRFSTTSTLFQLAILFSALFLLQACDYNNNNSREPDFSTVPDPYDLSEADTTYTKEGGVEIYIIEQGNQQFEVIPRDRINVKFTGRTIDGRIFQSTYADGNTEARQITNLKPVASGSQTSAPIEGFRRGLLGMTEGEKRVIFVPPSLGYNDSRTGANGMDLRDDSLRYDVELVSIQ